MLLCGYDRGVVRGSGKAVREQVKCHLWFTDTAEAMAFVAEQRGGIAIPNGETYHRSLPDFYTKKMQFAQEAGG